MKVVILQDLRLWHKEGEVLEVTEEVAEMLIRAGAAEKKEGKKKK